MKAFTSLTAPPLPEPPENEFADIEKRKFIESHPYLFHITTPICINHISELLTTHPN